jgi:hypothetical protein
MAYQPIKNSIYFDGLWYDLNYYVLILFVYSHCLVDIINYFLSLHYKNKELFFFLLKINTLLHWRKTVSIYRFYQYIKGFFECRELNRIICNRKSIQLEFYLETYSSYLNYYN